MQEWQQNAQTTLFLPCSTHLFNQILLVEVLERQANDKREPPRRPMQNLPHYQVNSKCNCAAAFERRRRGRLHAVLARHPTRTEPAPEPQNSCLWLLVYSDPTRCNTTRTNEPPCSSFGQVTNQADTCSILSICRREVTDCFNALSTESIDSPEGSPSASRLFLSKTTTRCKPSSPATRT